ncbi:MAG TPA: TIR domain-containing protein [Ilumatobacteraceae bacterium]|nr:TIR domain-containing protein [Ilumatobacteraceae bacterium]
MSYSRRDTEFVEKLDRALTARGYDIWVDSDDIVGSGEDRWRRSIVKAIRECDAIVLVLSPNSTASANVERELTVAADNGKRVVPLMYRACELPDGFQYELAGVQYVDFTVLDFNQGVQHLVTHLGPTITPEPPEPDDRASGAPQADDQVGLEGRRRWIVLAGVGVALAAIAAMVTVMSMGGGDESADARLDRTTDASSVATADQPDVSTDTTAISAAPSTTPATSAAIPNPEQLQAQELVNEWADATTRRDFVEAARLDTSMTAEQLEALYRPADAPTRMIAVQPYIAETVADGPLWRSTGAAMAWDYDEEPTIRTHVICSEWVVDLAAGTMRWEPGEDAFVQEQISQERFDETFSAFCS